MVAAVVLVSLVQFWSLPGQDWHSSFSALQCTWYSLARVRLIDQQFCISAHINKWPAVHNESLCEWRNEEEWGEQVKQVEHSRVQKAVDSMASQGKQQQQQLNESSHWAVAHAHRTHAHFARRTYFYIRLIILILEQQQHQWGLWWLPVHWPFYLFLCPLFLCLQLSVASGHISLPSSARQWNYLIWCSSSWCVNSNSNYGRNYFLFHFLLGQTLSRSKARECDEKANIDGFTARCFPLPLAHSLTLAS